jgi:ATP-dependent DNA ligase
MAPVLVMHAGATFFPDICHLLSAAYLGRMFKPFEFCLPTKSAGVPSGPDWLHEIKYDGYRIRLVRDSDRVRLITRGGHGWTDRYPAIVEPARKIRQQQFVLDGEAVILGVADFNALHSRNSVSGHDRNHQRCCA